MKKSPRRCPTCNDVSVVRYENIGNCPDSWHRAEAEASSPKPPLSAELSKAYEFSTQEDTVMAMEMGRELYEFGRKQGEAAGLEKLTNKLQEMRRMGEQKDDPRMTNKAQAMLDVD